MGEDGTVKVLDFGLAKALAGDVPDADLSQSPTVTASGTREGVILGTAAYMSPEQARGKVLDKRTDIWSFGCVLFEMLTGRAAFAGETLSDTIGRVMEREPEWAALPARTPASIRRLLARCLDKDPRDRQRDIGDVRVALRDGGTSALPDDAPVAATSRFGSRILPWVAGIGIGVAFGIGVSPRETPDASVVRLSFPLIPLPATTISGHRVVISPDGRQIVQLAGEGLWLRRLDRFDPVLIDGTAGAQEPFFSPDGEWIGFQSGGTLKKVRADGGVPVALAEWAIPRGASWGDDGTILYTRESDGIWQVAAGGTPRRVVAVSDRALAHGPQKLPGGDLILFTLRPGQARSWEESQVVVQSLASGERTVLVEQGRDARFVSPGYLLYVLEGLLLGSTFEVETLRVGGRVSLGIALGLSDGGPFTAAAHFGVSPNGSLLYLPETPSRGAGPDLLWVDREGNAELVGTPPRRYLHPRVSPDGRRLVYADMVPGNSDVWVYDLQRGTETRVTTDPGFDDRPMWTLDGERVVFASTREGTSNLFWRSADGTGEVDRLTSSPNLQRPGSYTANGESLVFYELPAQSRDVDVWELSLEGGTRRPLVQSPASETRPAVSPDGRWLAYQSDETGRYEIYVQPLHDERTGEREIVSTNGGNSPAWSLEGDELFYLSGQAMMSVSLTPGAELDLGSPRVLFEGPFLSGDFGRDRPYDVTLGGERFLMIADPPQTSRQVNVILNWFEELDQLVPVN